MNNDAKKGVVLGFLIGLILVAVAYSVTMLARFYENVKEGDSGSSLDISATDQIVLENDNNTPVEKKTLPTSTVSRGNNIKVYYFNVGQADCTYIVSGDSNMLIDGGNLEDGPLVSAYLQELGVTTLEYVVCTHAHEDHFGGLESIVSDIPAEHIIMPNSVFESEPYSIFCDKVQDSGIDVIYPANGDSYTLGEAVWTVISCAEGTPEDPNGSSIVIYLSFGDIDFLFCGDAIIENEERIMAEYDVDAEILKASHHGSYTSNSNEWIEAVSPDIIIVSVGKNNEYNLPNSDVMQRFTDSGAEIYRTDTDGTIQITSDGHVFLVDCLTTELDGVA